MHIFYFIFHIYKFIIIIKQIYFFNFQIYKSRICLCSGRCSGSGSSPNPVQLINFRKLFGLGFDLVNSGELSGLGKLPDLGWDLFQFGKLFVPAKRKPRRRILDQSSPTSGMIFLFKLKKKPLHMITLVHIWYYNNTRIYIYLIILLIMMLKCTLMKEQINFFKSNQKNPAVDKTQSFKGFLTTTPLYFLYLW